MSYRFLFVFFVVFSVPRLSAQLNVSSEYTLYGLLVDDVSGAPIAHANIVHVDLPKGITSDKNGRFAMVLSKGAHLRFSAVGYEELKLFVPDSVLELNERWVVRMYSALYQLPEVLVQEDKAVPLAYRSEVFKEKPTVGDLLVTPISYFYYYFSKREKKKRAVLTLIEREQLLQRFAYIIGERAIAELTGWSGEELELCMRYCNAYLDLSMSDDEFIVRRKLMLVLTDYYNYKKQNYETNSGIRVDH